jgi:hypothetical protein
MLVQCSNISIKHFRIFEKYIIYPHFQFFPAFYPDRVNYFTSRFLHL